MRNSCVQSSWAEAELGGGISGSAMFATPMGMCPAGRLREGDILRAAGAGPVSIVSIMPAPVQDWIRIAPMALGNRHAVIVGVGQGVLIESSFALRMVGSAAVVLPALALCNWRGIARCAPPKRGLRLTLSQPALLVGSTGLLLAASGPANAPANAPHIGQLGGNLPPVPNVSLATAQQLLACLIAHDAGAMLRDNRPYAAVF